MTDDDPRSTENHRTYPVPPHPDDAIIDAILDGSIEEAETSMLPIFNLEIPKALHDVDSGILDPRDTYADPGEWEPKAVDLAERFIKNFALFSNNEEGQALVAAGPQL